MLTPDDVRNVVFSGAWRKERGYDEAEVDRFLARVEATLRGKRLVTARDVVTARFSPRKKGARAYKKSQVDRFLDQVALTLMKLEVRDEEELPRKHRLRSGAGAKTSGGRRRWAEPQDDAPEQPAPEQHAAGQHPAEQPTSQQPARPRRPERPDPEATRGQLPQRPRPAQPAQPPRATPRPVLPPAAVAAEAPETVQAPAPAPPPPQVPRAAQATASASEMVRDPARFGALEPAKSLSSALDKAEVDAFMDRVQATLRGADAVSSKDVLNARFNPPGPGMPGYDEEGVLAFLKVVAVSIQNLTARNLRPVAPSAASPDGSGRGTGPIPQPAGDQRPTTTNVRPIAPDGSPPAGAFPARLSGDLQTGQNASQPG
ncbi:DivIVA domain-containing protein [Saccharopolyspora griseoalba]|uniref:Cell wall synthesis protein Wag31 n=1 Tax=Saccharopolyspora griseoalba TaxID=1431848 RepID=A0ABW2LCI4_9PSEU